MTAIESNVSPVQHARNSSLSESQTILISKKVVMAAHFCSLSRPVEPPQLAEIGIRVFPNDSSSPSRSRKRYRDPTVACGTGAEELGAGHAKQSNSS
jgi:hypothetical protein